ncbi:DUF4272 domain-containing protein [Sphingomonas sp. G-3-2-10]|uniref:DUF4272 domain-containing protein n=1 Tax=Sphingomonas sp. G-3-2-10 TaxID=2728838 RepID=UPI00146B849D|nr:DUF4272 domain-containing protein [Sphingomonas sp. G-3-2-10]NML04915.1 DUF4272 domain-containing protein [Sphingomonas sp. G-3-2-10]
MKAEEIRQTTVTELLKLGFNLPAQLPLTEASSFQSGRTIFSRFACLHLCAAVAYGLPTDRALAWAEAEGVLHHLEPQEDSFLQKPSADPRFQQQVEGMFALCWALGTEDRLDWFTAVDNHFVRRVPDLRSSEGLASLKQRTRARENGEIAQATDLGYCVHWLWREAAIGRGATLPVPEYVVAERRRALEWLTGHGAWYEISLDT